MAKCTHLDQIQEVSANTPGGCEECLASGGKWVQLRMCCVCGHVGCCDSSAGRHATKHFDATAHAIMRSAEPGQDWGWCYVDKLQLGSRELASNQ